MERKVILSELFVTMSSFPTKSWIWSKAVIGLSRPPQKGLVVIVDAAKQVATTVVFNKKRRLLFLFDKIG